MTQAGIYMVDFHPVWYHSSDDLRLFAREYRRTQSSPFTLLCLHGLTRNAADFDAFCDALADDYHILAVDQRGRGNSDYDPHPERYQIATYATDMFTLIEERELDRVVPVGTSMGGLVALQMLAMRPDLFPALVLNDIGAQVEGEGLQRIQSYLTSNKVPPQTWQEAADQTREINEIAYPDYGEEDWERLARKYYREDTDGRPVRTCDPRIAATGDPSRPAETLDLWPLFDSIADIPMLVVRGELSDILSRACVEEMKAHKSRVESVEVPQRGHAPMLDEPEALDAIQSFLADLAEG